MSVGREGGREKQRSNLVLVLCGNLLLQKQHRAPVKNLASASTLGREVLVTTAVLPSRYCSPNGHLTVWEPSHQCVPVV